MDVYFKLLLIFGIIFQFAHAQYIPCNGNLAVTGGFQTRYIYWSANTTGARTSCTYLIKAPVDHYFEATIWTSLDGSEPNCATQRLWVSKGGMNNFADASFFCGNRGSTPIQIKSIGNEMTFAIQSNRMAGLVRITIISIKITQSNCQCSWSRTPRIVAGSNAIATEFIGHAAIKSKSMSFNEAVCGGIIITQNHVISAAHCNEFIRMNGGIARYEVHVGRQNITATLAADSVYAAAYQILSILTHPSYVASTNMNDIALLTTTTYIQFNRGVGSACLPFMYENFNVADNTIMTAIGFGSTEFALGAQGDRQSWILQKAQLVVNASLSSTCSRDTTKLCAKGTFRSAAGLISDTCQRDSGGGLYGYVYNRYYCFGIVSHGGACGSRSSFSVNTYVPKYFAWIRARIGSNILCDKRS